MTKRNLVLSKPFQRAYKRFVIKNPLLKSAIGESLLKLEENAFAPGLKTHKLSGNLYGYFACTCGYDCRIVFSIEKNSKLKGEFILLIDIGTHDEVY
ncbi:MAG TPA: type II toxin-antitoxin system YafQ family toxin [Hanamia sp.]